MTIAALIKTLQTYDPKRIVVLSSDSEGNSYAPLDCIQPYAYCHDTREIGLEKLTATDKKAGYGEDDLLKGGRPALVLYPAN